MINGRVGAGETACSARGALESLSSKDGWRHVKTRGSHRQYKHPSKPGRVTIPGHPGDDLHPDTLKSILTQAGLKEKP